jgi:type II secretory pathway pseudopilin PulG
MVDDRRFRVSGRGVGYNLVALMVLVAVINITVAAALPSVSQAMRREREAELIFRGLQYAEAIRVFQLRTGRYPTSLRELLETNPRCIRQLWTDPFNDDGEWGLILGRGAATGRQLTSGAPPTAQDSEERRRPQRSRRQTLPEEVEPRENVSDPNGRGVPRRGQVVSRGPIIGVKSVSDEESVRSFMGSEKYKDWLFTVELIPTMEVAAVGENVPRLHTLWVGKPLPEGLGGIQAGSTPSGRERNPLQRRSPRRRQSDG